jgi:hypothetical protein
MEVDAGGVHDRYVEAANDMTTTAALKGGVAYSAAMIASPISFVLTSFSPGRFW